jgi:hypothetical protein
MRSAHGLNFIVLLFLASGIGCSWHSGTSDIIIGPAFFRYALRTNDPSLVTETRALPLEFEGGSQWGLYLGDFKRIASNCGTNLPVEPARGLLISTNQEAWHLSPFYLKLSHPEPPEFIARSNLGVSASAGAETTHLTVGGSSSTLLRPESDCWYLLDYHSKDPMRIRFKKYFSPDAKTIRTELMINQIKQ